VATTIAGKATIASAVVASAAVAAWAYTVSRPTAPAVPESAAPGIVAPARTPESPSVAAVPSAVPLDALPRASVEAPTRTRGDQGQPRTADERPAATPSANAVPAERLDLAETPGGSPPPPSARRTEDTAEEVAVVAEAERLVTSNPARALTLVRSLDSRAPAGFLREERHYVATMALLQMNAPGARDQARRFLQSYPASPYAPRIRAKVGALAEP
jgi:hypothetical protein